MNTHGRFWESGWYAIFGGKVVHVELLQRSPASTALNVARGIPGYRQDWEVIVGESILSRDPAELERKLAFEALSR